MADKDNYTSRRKIVWQIKKTTIMTIQEFESKQQEYATISDTRYSIEKLSRAIDNFKKDNPNTDYDASRLEDLFLTLSLFEGFNSGAFKKGVCYMADIVLDYEKKNMKKW